MGKTLPTQAIDLRGILEQLADLVVERMESRTAVSTPKRLMSLKEAGVYLGRTAASVQQLVARGEIPAVTHGRRKHVLVSDLDDWIERNRTA